MSRGGPQKRTPDLRVPVLLVPVLLVLAVFLSYLPALQGEFLWDDDAHVTRPDLRSLSGLARIWFEVGATQQYYPLLHSAFWVEHQLFGNDPRPYHVVNVALHAACAVLFFGLLGRLGAKGATLAAALFALHPVHVESVAWISEQKNTLSLLFYLLAARAYLRFRETQSRYDYLAASGLFVCGLLTKTVVATLPAELLVVRWWQAGRLSGRDDVRPLLPWFGLGAGAGLFTAWFESRLLGAEGADFALDAGSRVVLAGRAAVFYLRQLVWPTQLAFIHPRWTIEATIAQLVPVVLVLGLLALAFAIRTRSRAPLAAMLFFLGSLFPVLGFLNVYPFVYSFVADHFVHLPSLGVLALIAAGAEIVLGRQSDQGRRLGHVLCGAVLTILAGMTWEQSRLYRDPQTLYEATLARNPECYLCLNNLGTIAAEGGRTSEAQPRFEAALRIKPDSAETRVNLGNVLVQTGHLADGIRQFEESLRIAPRNVTARTNLGIALAGAGRLDEAAGQFEEALRIMPEYEPARHNLGVIRTRLPPPRPVRSAPMGN